ncbi:MAG: outer membrane beta-barrel protein [Steroidobacteraceae bacterium]
MSAYKSVCSLLPPMLCLALVAGNARADDDEDVDPFTISLYSQAVRDDNLFRLADNYAALGVTLPAGASREDDVFSTGLAIDGRKQYSRQLWQVSADIASRRFANNDSFNYVGGNGALRWNWSTAADLSGTLAASYNRFLSGFANNTSYTRDLIQSYNYTGSLLWGLGARWSLTAEGGYKQSRHDAATRAYQDVDAVTGTVGLQYETRRGHLLGWNYTHGHGQYPDPLSNYNDDAAKLSWTLLLSEVLSFEGQAGYQKREYPGDAGRNFSGDVWNADLNWKPGGRSSVLLSGWRAVRAWEDADADHYVATGVQLRPVWDTGLHWSAELVGSWEHQRYLSDTGVSARIDNLGVAGITLRYTFLKRLQLSGGARLEQRQSTEALYRYDDHVYTLGVRASW